MAIVETRDFEERATQIVNKLGFSKAFVIDPVGFFGDLWLLWNPSIVDISCTSYSRWSIHVVVSLVNYHLSQPWLLSSIYGSPNHAICQQLWDELEAVSSMSGCSWLTLGDFNTVLRHGDKVGGNPLTLSQSQELTNVFNRCGIIDLVSSGPKFTWNNHQVGCHNIKERIDRVDVNGSFQMQFPVVQVNNLSYFNSGHRAILIDFNPVKSKPCSRPFRLEAMWLEDPRFEHVVSQCWSTLYATLANPSIFDKFRSLRKHDLFWNKVVFGQLRNNIQNAKSTLFLSQQHFDIVPSQFNKDVVDSCLISYLDALHLEEVFWHQKSRVKWIKCGNLNIHFFHISTLVHRHKNQILIIKDNNGTWVSGQDQVSSVLVDFFRYLFTSSGPSACNLSFLQPLVRNRISSDVNTILVAPVTDSKILSALHDMGPLKAPGPDGFQSQFFC